jgi:hypothetical protein
MRSTLAALLTLPVVGLVSTLIVGYPLIASAAAAEAAETAPSDEREIDMLAPDGEVVWKAFHEDPKARFEDVWKVTDGVLICRGTPKGYIHTAKDYTDFVLRLQWRWPPGKPPGNGGVLLRMTGEDRIWPKSLEAQINHGQAGDFWGLAGYALQGPAERFKSLDNPQFGKLTNVAKSQAAEKPAGQWNQYEIVARGDKVTLKINGKVVNEATGCEATPGKICLTAEGDEIHFRNVVLTPLDKDHEPE